MSVCRFLSAGSIGSTHFFSVQVAGNVFEGEGESQEEAAVGALTTAFAFLLPPIFVCQWWPSKGLKGDQVVEEFLTCLDK